MSRVLGKAGLLSAAVLCAFSFAASLSAQENVRIPKVATQSPAKIKQLRPLMSKGKPIFVIGAYGIPADCTPAELRSAGWNTVLLNFDDPNLKNLLHGCGNAGIGVIPNMTVPVRANNREEVRAFIKEYRSYPAIFGYYLCDEPENFYDPEGYKIAEKNRPGLTREDFIKESLGWVRATARELDPKRYTFMCIAWWSSYMNLQSLCDVNMPNSYPTNNTKNEFEGTPAEILYDARLAAAAAQAYGGLGYVYTPYALDKNQGIESYRTPTIREFRYSVYAPITAGSMGMFSWAGYRCSKSYAQKVIFPVTRELNALTPFLVGTWMDDKLKCEPSASTNSLLKEYKLPEVNGCLRRAADGRYLLVAVNNTNAPVKAAFAIDIKNLPDTCKDFISGTAAAIDRGTISTTLSPYDVRAYVFSAKE